MPGFLPLPLVGYGVSLTFAASLRSSKNGSLAITSFKNDRQECNTIEKCNAPLPSFLSGEQNRNVNKRKKYNMTLSEESGVGYRKTHLISPTSAWILHSTSYFFILVFPIAFYDRSRKTGRYLMLFARNCFSYLL